MLRLSNNYHNGSQGATECNLEIGIVASIQCIGTQYSPTGSDPLDSFHHGYLRLPAQ